jgi:hypothetical protein
MIADQTALEYYKILNGIKIDYLKLKLPYNIISDDDIKLTYKQVEMDYIKDKNYFVIADKSKGNKFNKTQDRGRSRERSDQPSSHNSRDHSNSQRSDRHSRDHSNSQRSDRHSRGHSRGHSNDSQRSDRRSRGHSRGHSKSRHNKPWKNKHGGNLEEILVYY